VIVGQWPFEQPRYSPYNDLPGVMLSSAEQTSGESLLVKPFSKGHRLVTANDLFGYRAHWICAANYCEIVAVIDMRRTGADGDLTAKVKQSWLFAACIGALYC